MMSNVVSRGILYGESRLSDMETNDLRRDLLSSAMIS